MSLAEGEKTLAIMKRHRVRGSMRLTVLNNLAISYHALGDLKTCIKMYRECIEQANKYYPEDYSSLAMYNINLAKSYEDDGDKERSREVLKAVGEWIEKAEFRPLVCDYYLRFAAISYELGDNEAGGKALDNAFERVPENIYPYPIYDDLREVSRFLVKNRDKARADKVLALMSVYSEQEPDTIGQLFVYRMMSDYYNGFGEKDRALECYKKLDELFERRVRELQDMQMDVFKMMKNANAEIDKLKKKMRESEALYSLESMTGLLNRSALLSLSAEFIETAAKKKQKVGGIFIDIDCFKECNDTYGHARGDEIIKEVANVCKKEETANVRFARYGGDEFFGITRGLDDGAVVEIARRICKNIRDEKIPNEKNKNGRIITLSVGVVNVAITDHTDTIIEIANFADKALYHAKDSGRNAVYLLDYNEADKKGKNAAFVKVDF